MPVLRYISILILNLLLIIESSSLGVLALSSEDIAVNSLESLSLPIEMDIASEKITETLPISAPKELKMDIQSLLIANQEYSQQYRVDGTVDIAREESTTVIDAIIDGESDAFDVFGDFFIDSETGLLDGAK